MINHNPICSCKERYTGDPFSACYIIETEPTIVEPLNPCLPSPCGLNAECRNIGGIPSCSCLIGFFGSPPNCKPECVLNTECSNDKACINMKCQNPCLGSCGLSAVCDVVNHVPMCSCPDGYEGDPFVSCSVKKTGTMHLQQHTNNISQHTTLSTFAFLYKLCLSLSLLRLRLFVISDC